MTNAVLMDLAVGLASGAVKVVDLSVTLSPHTPILELPEEFGWGKSWPFSKQEISRYDDRGPAWYWNNIKCGEHTGTHFDAPVHWVTGQDLPDNATDTLPPERFIGPAVVIDAVAEAENDPDFLMSLDFLKSWESENGKIPDGACVLYRTDWSKIPLKRPTSITMRPAVIHQAGTQKRSLSWPKSGTSLEWGSRLWVPTQGRRRGRIPCSPVII